MRTKFPELFCIEDTLILKTKISRKFRNFKENFAKKVFLTSEKLEFFSFWEGREGGIRTFLRVSTYISIIIRIDFRREDDRGVTRKHFFFFFPDFSSSLSARTFSYTIRFGNRNFALTTYYELTLSFGRTSPPPKGYYQIDGYKLSIRNSQILLIKIMRKLLTGGERKS